MKSSARDQPCANGSLPVLTAEAATCYTIRNGWAWAHIFVRHGVGQTGSGDPRGWVHVAVISDYGSFGYCWTHIGGTPWVEFLTNLDMHYAMQKMLGERFRVPLSGSEALDRALPLIIDNRRNGMSKADARELFDAAKEAETCDGVQAFLRDWDDRSGGLFYRHELWDSRWDKVNPQAEGFWRDIWPHFLTAIGDGTGGDPSPTGQLRDLKQPISPHEGTASTDQNNHPKSEGAGE